MAMRNFLHTFPKWHGHWIKNKHTCGEVSSGVSSKTEAYLLETNQKAVFTKGMTHAFMTHTYKVHGKPRLKSIQTKACQ